MDDAIFGKKLRELRIQAGKTVPEVSEYLKSVGCKAATQTIYGWERGHSQPTIDTFMEMCIFYGVTDIFSHFGETPIETKNSPSTAEAAPGEALHSVDDWKRAIDKMTKKQCRDAIILLLDKFMEGEE